MEYTFRLRPSDSFEIGSKKVVLHRIQSNRRISVKLVDGDDSKRIELVLGQGFEIEPGIVIELDPTTSRASMSAELRVTAPDSVRVTSPD
jgi:hypothetical protein